jgi:hypothetical protein
MPRKVLIILIDGGDPQYFDHAEVPNLRRIGASGFWVNGTCVIPSVTTSRRLAPNVRSTHWRSTSGCWRRLG